MVDVAVRRDRRTHLKQQHRAALVSAAAELLDERGAGFSVDELAERAGVARRTVFNHFSSLDDVMVEVGLGDLGALLVEYDAAAAAIGSAAPSTVLGQVHETLRRMDLVPAIARLTRRFDPGSPSGGILLERALALFTPRLVAEARQRSPEADPLDAELLVASLTSGLVVIQRHWAERTGAVVSARSRAEWDELVDLLLDRLRHGHPDPDVPEAPHG